jgi:hypothetical protein
VKGCVGHAGTSEWSEPKGQRGPTPKGRGVRPQRAEGSDPKGQSGPSQRAERSDPKCGAVRPHVRGGLREVRGGLREVRGGLREGQSGPWGAE